MNVKDENKIVCTKHGSVYTTYVCSHLINGENKEWYSDNPDEENKWPDAWCGGCHKHYDAEGEWNAESESSAGVESIKMLCHKCYEELKSKCNVHYLED